MNDTLQSFLVSTAGLGIVLVVAFIVAYQGGSISQAGMTTLRRPLFIMVAIHLLHLVEETYTEFYVIFPNLLGQQSWPVSVFLGFNLALVVIWVFGARQSTPSRIFLAAFWFLALASALNGIAHPVLSMISGGYFPGLITSPLVGVFGVLLARSLTLATDHRQSSSSNKKVIADDQ